MNDSFTSTLFMGVMFVLRCMIPLGILFGISYLLKRMELVVNDDQANEPAPVEDEDAEQAEDESADGESDAEVEPEAAPQKTAARKPVSAKNKTSGAKKKSAASKKES